MNLLTNPDEVSLFVAAELPDVVDRALKSGAIPPLTYAGAGASGVVLCDARGIAYKVGRGRAEHAYQILEAEAEFLLDARNTEIRDRVAAIRAWHPTRTVIERECIRGYPASWGTRGIRDAYERIVHVMRPLGWGGPEYKENSFVVEEDTGRIVLVDAGHVVRLGSKLLQYIERALDGRQPYREPWSDLHWQLRQDIREGLVQCDVGVPYLRAIEDRAGDPKLSEDRRSLAIDKVC